MNSFSHHVKTETQVLPSSEELKVQITEFVDKLVIFLSYNGEMDTTYSIRIPDKNILASIQGSAVSNEEFDQGPDGSQKQHYDIDDDEEYDNEHGLSRDLLDQTSNIEPFCLMGNSANIKLRVLCGQLLALLLSINKNEARNVILSVSSKVFKGKEELHGEDFDRLLIIMQLVKNCYLQKGAL